jgi:hypothetical protein
MSTIAVFEMMDKNRTPYALTFNLYNSSLAKRWQAMVEQNVQAQHEIYASFINLTYDRLPEVLEELNEMVAIINRNYDKKLPEFISTEILDQQILNDLHEEYEVYGGRIDQFESKKLHASFLRLNELIHACEEMTATKDKKFIPMSALIDYYPQGIHEPLKDQDKVYLTTDFNWGKLYLGYNTLGKDWLEVQRHNDLDVILRNQVRKQERFAAECWLNFTQDDTCKWNATQFEKWYDKLSPEIQAQVPVDDMSALALGRYEIGTLEITENFLEYHNNKSDWLVPEHPIKAKWNKEVFSTFKIVKSIKFINV